MQTVFSLSPFVSTKQWESYYESCVIERCDNFTRREEEKWPVTPHTLQTSAVVVDVLIPKNLDGFFHVVLFSRPPGDGRAESNCRRWAGKVVHTVLHTGEGNNGRVTLGACCAFPFTLR